VILKLIQLSINGITHLLLELIDFFLCILIGSKNAFSLKVFLFKKTKVLFPNNIYRTMRIGRHIRNNALNIEYVDPIKIKYRVRRGSGPSPYIEAGNWDLMKTPFKWNESVKQLFVEKLKPEETDQYKQMKSSIDEQDWHMSRNCRNEKDLVLYFQTLFDIYNDMKNDSFKPSSESKPIYQNTRKRYYPDEICISIGRNGEYIAERGGGHRISMAQLLKVEKIPVIVIGMHYDYFMKNKLKI
tara:strand:+ start:15979 stop:16704 length:726 start_codon:yes stop_codon:yes gene_type:complete